MMKILWKYLPCIIVVLLCVTGLVGAQDSNAKQDGGTGTANITAYQAPGTGTASIMSAASTEGVISVTSLSEDKSSPVQNSGNNPPNGPANLSFYQMYNTGDAGSVSAASASSGTVSAANSPDEYSIRNTVKFDSAGYPQISKDSCGGAEKQITSGNQNHVNARLSDSRIVYEEWNDGASAIGMYELSNGAYNPVFTSNQQQTNPDTSGRYIVYEQAGANGNAITNIYIYDTQSKTSTLLSPSTSNQNTPSISGRFVVWQDWRSGHPNIWIADLASGVVQPIDNSASEEKNPEVAGNLVVWEDWRNGNADVYLYDLASGKEYQLTSDNHDQKKPRISGNLVVWEDYRNGVPDIYAMTLDTMKETRLTFGSGKAVNPDVSGPYVVWEDHRNAHSSVLLLDLTCGKLYKITSDSTDSSDHTNPSVRGSNVIWQDYRGGNSNIYLYKINSASSGTPSSGSPSGVSYRLFGSATLCGNAAPAGSTISAVVGNSGSVRSSLVTTAPGSYGSTYGPYLEVPLYQGDIGKTMTFLINNQPADQSFTIGNGGTQQLDLASSCNTQASNYQLSGAAMINNQYAPVGTTISAVIGSTVRGQTTLSQAGQYSNLNIPVYSTDNSQIITFTAQYAGSTYTAAQQITAGQQVSTPFDLSFGTSSQSRSFSFSGSSLLNGQGSPAGTVISASVDNAVRGQVQVSQPGQYSNLVVPVYSGDSGKYISFTATYNGVSYSATQQYQIGNVVGNPSGITVMSTDGVSAQGAVQRLDLTFSNTPQSKYRFYGQASIDGSGMPAGKTIYAYVDGQVRGQISITTSGQYGGSSGPYLEVPFTQADIGKYIRFQTDNGIEGDQAQLIVSGLTVQKSINFITKPSVGADFTATPTQGSAPLSVKFNDRSSGSPKTFYWEFGDGTTSTEMNPTHVYKKDGVYSVGEMVTYYNGATKSSVKQGYISVGAVSPPSAQISLNAGWNFISTPKTLADGQNTAKVLFGQIDVGGHSVFAYSPRTKSWTTVSASTTINPMDAIWIYSTHQDTIYLYFAPDALQIPPTKKLVKGWNTFGVTSLKTVPAYNAMLSIKDRWVYIIGFDSSTQKYQSTIMNVPDSYSSLLNPGFGYWVYMSDDGDLAGVGL